MRLDASLERGAGRAPVQVRISKGWVDRATRNDVNVEAAFEGKTPCHILLIHSLPMLLQLAADRFEERGE